MATKMKILTFLQAMRGYAQVSNRIPAPRPSVLYLMKLRGKKPQPNVPKRRLAIAVESSGGVNVPLPIKINHVKSETQMLRVFVR